MEHDCNDPTNHYMMREDSRYAVVFMYRIIEEPRDKFILMAVMESGYKQEEVARMIGVSQELVNQRLKYIKKMLKMKKEKVIK